MITIDDIKARAIALRTEAAEFKDSITLGTAEQWNAWDDLDTAARMLWSAACHLEQHEFKTGVRK